MNCGLDQADLIITVGYHTAEYPPFLWNGKQDKTILNIDFVESEPDPYFNPAVEVVGDISCSLREIGERIPGKRAFPAFARTRSLIEKKIHENLESRHPPLPQEIVRNVREVLSPQDIVALDNGIYKPWFSRLYPAFRPNTFLLDNALATMGGRSSDGDCGQDALSSEKGAGGGRGWRIHDEFSGAGRQPYDPGCRSSSYC